MSAVAGTLAAMEDSREQIDWGDGSVAARYVVRARRRADLSQRELALAVGSSQSAIGRIERGSVQPTVGSLAAILGLAGLKLVVDDSGHEVAPASADAVRDNQGRRFPAHLDVDPPDEVPYDRWAFPRYDRPAARAWYRHRALRDRMAEGVPHRERPADHPTETELERRRRLMRGRQPRVDPPPPPDLVCTCPDACFEEVCVAACPCQCEPARDRYGRRLGLLPPLGAAEGDEETSAS